MSEILDRLMHRGKPHMTAQDLGALAKVSMKRTKPGTPMREVMNPAQAWAVGVLAPTGAPTPLERHVPMENPAPEDASVSQIRMEWRAHKAVARAIEKGQLVRPGPHNPKAKNYREAHHPDYAQPLNVRWETKDEHAGNEHRYNPASVSLMDRARQQSETFHGSPKFVTEVDGEPKVLLGSVPELDYDVPSGSQRTGKWTHRAGDTLIGGLFRSRRPGPRVELVADVKTGDPELLQHGSHMRFDARYGLMG